MLNKTVSTENHTEYVQKILSGARWVTIFRTGAQLFSWLSTILVVRYIIPEDYGLNSMLESPLNIIMTLSILGLDSALVQRKHINHEELSSVFGFLLFINAIIFAAFFFGSVLLAAYFNEPRLIPLSKTLAFIFLLIPFRVIPNALLDRALDFKLKAKIEFVASIVTALTTLTLAYLGAGVWALVIGVIVNRSLQALLLMILKPWFIVPSLNFADSWKMMAFGGIITLSGLIAMTSDMLVTLLAGPHLGPDLLGIYGVAATFAMLPLSKGMPIINQTMVPAFSKFQENRSSAAYYHEKLLGVVMLLFIPVIIGTASISHAFILVIVGAEWERCIFPLQIMSIGIIFRLSSILYTPVITSMGRADLRLKLSTLQLIFMLPLTFLAIDYGVSGLMTIWALTEFIMMIVTINLSKRVFDSSFKKFIIALRPAIVSSLLMAACVTAIKPLMTDQPFLIVLVVQILIGMFTYLLLVKLFYSKQFTVAKNAIFGERYLK